MQLKQAKSIRRQLAIATSSLLVAAPLQTVSAVEAGADQMDDIAVEVSRLYYAEEGRVTVNKTQTLITKELSEDSRIKVNVTYDTMSGSSPNGRIYNPNALGASSTVAVTTASGFSFDAAANASSASKKPWLTPFSDNRIASNIEWEKGVTRTATIALGGGISSENDYDSYSGSGKFIWDVNQRRTTLTTGVGYSNDYVEPSTGVPDGLGELRCINPITQLDWLASCDSTDLTFDKKPANKVTVDYFFGLTQVWNRNTLVQLNYSHGTEDGYLTDPYKQISVVNPGLNYQELAVLYEKRPSTRETQSLFFKIINVPSERTTVHMSYRFFWDDWDVQAHTTDVRFRFNLGTKDYIQPHLRVSYQSAAFFSHRFIADEANSDFSEKPEYVSADHRLSKQGTITAGIKYGKQLGKFGRFGARIEQMHQKYSQNMLPDMKVWIVQFLLSTRF